MGKHQQNFNAEMWQSYVYECVLGWGVEKWAGTMFKTLSKIKYLPWLWARWRIFDVTYLAVSASTKDSELIFSSCASRPTIRELLVRLKETFIFIFQSVFNKNRTKIFCFTSQGKIQLVTFFKCKVSSLVK